MTMISDVTAFHAKFGIPIQTVPAVPSEERLALRERLITEEYSELMVALGYAEYHSDMGAGWMRPADSTPNLPETADAIADLVYVLIGAALEFGIPLQAVWDRVQATNMAKEGGPTRADGKILKPLGWVAPDIEGCLREHGWKP